MDLEYKKYAIFFWIVLIVAGTTACGGKDTVSKKDRIKEIEVYDDDNEPVTIQENEIVNTEFYELSGDKFRSYIKKEKFTKENWKEFFSIREEHLEYNEYQSEGDLYHLGIYKVHQKKDFCMVFDIVNDDMESRDNVFEKGTGTLGWGQNKSDGTKFQLTIDDVSCTKAEGTIIYVDISEELWQPCSDGTDRKGFRVKDGEKLYEFYDDGTPVKLDMFR